MRDKSLKCTSNFTLAHYACSIKRYLNVQFWQTIKGLALVSNVQLYRKNKDAQVFG